MYLYALNAPCPNCHTGVIQTNDACQYCTSCGVVLGVGAGTRPFLTLRPGEEFFAWSAIDTYVWRRAMRWERVPPNCNAYTLGPQTIYAHFDDNAPCIRVEERKMLGTFFGYN